MPGHSLIDLRFGIPLFIDRRTTVELWKFSLFLERFQVCYIINMPQAISQDDVRGHQLERFCSAARKSEGGFKNTTKHYILHVKQNFQKYCSSSSEVAFAHSMSILDFRPILTRQTTNTGLKMLR